MSHWSAQVLPVLSLTKPPTVRLASCQNNLEQGSNSVHEQLNPKTNFLFKALRANIPEPAGRPGGRRLRTTTERVFIAASPALKLTGSASGRTANKHDHQPRCHFEPLLSGRKECCKTTEFCKTLAPTNIPLTELSIRQQPRAQVQYSLAHRRSVCFPPNIYYLSALAAGWHSRTSVGYKRFHMTFFFSVMTFEGNGCLQYLLLSHTNAMSLLCKLPRDLYFHVVAWLTAQDLVSVARSSRLHHKHLLGSESPAWKIIFAAEFPGHILLTKRQHVAKEEGTRLETKHPKFCPDIHPSAALLPHIRERRSPSTENFSRCESDSKSIKFRQEYLRMVSEENLKMFRDSPERWESDLFSNFPDETDQHRSVGRFLKRNKSRLSQERVNAYLCPESRRRSLYAFAASLTWKNLELEWALRAWLAILWLPASSRAVDRAFHALALAYHSQHPGRFSSPDEVYIVLFALVMLSTDLHHPNVKHKMSLRSWLGSPMWQTTSNNGTAPAGSMGQAELTTLYHSVRSCPVVWKLQASSKQGWVYVEANAFPNYKADTAPTGTGTWLQQTSSYFSSLARTRYLRVWCIASEGQLLLYSAPPQNSRVHLNSFGSEDKQGKEELLLRFDFRPLASAPTPHVASAEQDLPTAELLPKAYSNEHIAGHVYPVRVRSGQEAIKLFFSSQPEKNGWFPCLLWTVHATRHGLSRFETLLPPTVRP
eukprot:g20056.t1